LSIVVSRCYDFRYATLHNGKSIREYRLIIHKAIDPTFARLLGSDQGVLYVAGVFAGVFVPGTVATTGITADHAHPQVDPTIARLQTIFTAIGAWLHILDQVLVLATIRRQLLPAP
jgi:hypothetical protein